MRQPPLKNTFWTPAFLASARLAEILWPAPAASVPLEKVWRKLEGGRVFEDARKGVEIGQRMGLIKFGSRVDVFLGPEWEIQVQPGMRVKAGSSVLARLFDSGKEG